MAISHWLAASPLQQFALPCYTVITYQNLTHKQAYRAVFLPYIQPGGGNFPPEILNPRKFLLVWIFERRSGTSCDLAVFFSLGVCKKMLPLGAIFEIKIHKNAYAARASPRTPLESLQSSQTPSWFSRSRFAVAEGRKWEGKEGNEERGRGNFFLEHLIVKWLILIND